MSFVILIGRILYGLIFLASGLAGHLAQADATTGYAEMRGLKGARPLVLLSGVLIAAGAVGVILGVYTDLAALGLAAYSLIAAVLVHHFWTDSGDAQQMEMTMFMKNLSMAGGGLILFAFVAAAGPALDLTITDPLFDFDL